MNLPMYENWKNPNDQPVDAPTPEEIARECAKIREEWSERDFYVRAGMEPPRWVVPFATTHSVVNDVTSQT